jgi:hypothetical protein
MVAQSLQPRRPRVRSGTPGNRARAVSRGVSVGRRGGGAFADCAVYGSAATPITADVDSLRPYPSEIPDSYPSVTLPRGTPTQAHGLASSGLVGASGAQVLGELAGLAFGRGSFERRVIGRAACDAGSAGRSNTNSATQPDTPPQGIPRRPLKPGHHQVPMPMISRRLVQVELPRSFVLPAASLPTRQYLRAAL